MRQIPIFITHCTRLSIKVSCIICTLVLCGESFSSEMPKSEQRLEAIKQSLIDLAMKSNLRLGSSAYIDSDGALHESSIISSDADIKGVRILSYLQEAGIDSVDLSADILSSSSCPNPQEKIRRQAIVRVGSGKSNGHTHTRVGDHYISELLEISEKALLDSLVDSPEWLASSETRYSSVYDHYMSGQIKDNAPYRFDIIISKKVETVGKGRAFFASSLESTHNLTSWAVGKIPELNYNKPWPKHDLVYEIVLVNRENESPLWRKSLQLSYPRTNRGYRKEDVPAALKYQIGRMTNKFLGQATEAIECRTDSYRLAVIPGRLDKFKIAAGSAVGVSIGDQFLIGDDSKILSQSLSMAGLAGLGLAEVESTTNRTATLRYVAGPRPKGMGGISNSVALHF
jgi:hypothetical protein